MRDGRGRPLACLLFGSAAWKSGVRDRFIGWSAAQREARLQGVTNPTRFLILPRVQVPRLASHLLGQVLRRLRADWHPKYGRPLELAETLVDSSRFTGACYRAANWINLGQTTGRTRQVGAQGSRRRRRWQGRTGEAVSNPPPGSSAGGTGRRDGLDQAKSLERRFPEPLIPVQSRVAVRRLLADSVEFKGRCFATASRVLPASWLFPME